LKYLLDTNICIYIINENPISVLENLNSHKNDEIYISAPTISELYYGVLNSKRKEENLMKLDKFLNAFKDSILEFDLKAAKQYASIRLFINQNGKRNIGDKDMDIAAVCLANDAILVTNNEKDFNFLPNLKIENWAR
jgi:toxin of toxin-antitoxin system